MKHFIIVAMGGLLLQACVPIPIFEPEPYSDEMLSQLTIGETSREEVVDMVGEPLGKWEDETVFFYRETQTVALIITTAPGGLIEYEHSLFVEFDQDDKLKRFERAEEDRAGPYPLCTSDGICSAILTDAERFQSKLPTSFEGHEYPTHIVYFVSAANALPPKTTALHSCDLFLYQLSRPTYGPII
ncbi:MAG TPA: hypothetical protein VJ972_03210, partial [Anaerolineales bacterium]|nr:hypothetical protein [Anaerolineales bacterium]